MKALYLTFGRLGFLVELILYDSHLFYCLLLYYYSNPTQVQFLLKAIFMESIRASGKNCSNVSEKFRYYM